MGFTVPSLPSFPSMRDLIPLDTSPQVFYPSSAANAKPSSSPSPSPSSASTSQFRQPATYHQKHPAGPTSQERPISVQGPRRYSIEATATRSYPNSPQRSGVGRVLPLPPVANDWSDQPISRGRRLSTCSDRHVRMSSSSCLVHGGLNEVSPVRSGGGGGALFGGKPPHRRSQSAVPFSLPTVNSSAYHGSSRQPQSSSTPSPHRNTVSPFENCSTNTTRSAGTTPIFGPSIHPQAHLQEISRNPLASLSTISLPTLTQLDLGSDTAGSSSSPVHRPPRSRHNSNVSHIPTISSSLPPSPRRPPKPSRANSEMGISSRTSTSGREANWSVPPPLPQPQAFPFVDNRGLYTSGAETNDCAAGAGGFVFPRGRPPPSPRSWASVIRDDDPIYESDPTEGDDEDFGPDRDRDDAGDAIGAVNVDKRGRRRPSAVSDISSISSVGIASASARSGTFQRPGHTRHASFTCGRAELSQSALSDVAVLATWSFPDSASSTCNPADHDYQPSTSTSTVQANGQQSHHLISSQPLKAQVQVPRPPSQLRDRLRTLSALDTSMSRPNHHSKPSSTNSFPRTNTMTSGTAGEMLPPPVPVLPSSSGQLGSVAKMPTARPNFLARLSHRHSLSSPNLLLGFNFGGSSSNSSSSSSSSSNTIMATSSSPGGTDIPTSTASTASTAIAPKGVKSELRSRAESPTISPNRPAPRPLPQRRSTNIGSGLRQPNPLGMIARYPAGVAGLSGGAQSETAISDSIINGSSQSNSNVNINSNSNSNALGLTSNTVHSPFDTPRRRATIPSSAPVGRGHGHTDRQSGTSGPGVLIPNRHTAGVNSISISARSSPAAAQSAGSLALSSSPGSMLSDSTTSTSTSRSNSGDVEMIASPTESLSSLPGTSTMPREQHSQPAQEEVLGLERNESEDRPVRRKWLGGFPWNVGSSASAGAAAGRLGFEHERVLQYDQVDASDDEDRARLSVSDDEEEYIDFDRI